jgi:hypothetical protein
MAKALLIKSSAGSKENIQGDWHVFDQATPYIQGIQTGDLVENIDAEILNSMISGLPSIWSRAKVFGYAFKYTQKDANIQTSGLIKFYETLVNEWKGLIALFALFPDRISIRKPIELQPDIIDELYTIPNAFGRMLFEDVDLWCNPDVWKTKREIRPFVQLIYYNNVLIGATSPYSLVFTAIDYNRLPSTSDVAWYRNGKFDDPLELGNLNNDQLQKLYLLVNNLVKKLPDFEKTLQSNRNGKEALSLSALFLFLRSWLDQIKKKGRDLVEVGALDAELVFNEPFTSLFRIKQNLYLNNGIFSYREDNKGAVIDIQKILLQDDFIYSFNQTDENQPLSEAAVHFLTALDPEDGNKTWYFPIPVSAYGLKIFKNQIGDLISPMQKNTHELRASFKASEFKLIVELYLMVDGQKQTPIAKEYEIKLITGAQRNVIMWPNFVSKNWNAYYLYSEYPSNARDIKMVPFFKNPSDRGGYDGVDYVVNNKGELIYLGDDAIGTNLEVRRLIQYPADIATSDDHPYEIIRTNRPVGGLEIRSLINGKDRVCGYLILKNPNDDTMLDRKIKDLSYETIFEDVVVGIDFGSNNSSVSYSKINQVEVKPIPYSNRRVFLVGSEIFDPNKEKTATRNELLFFQNESSENGQIKSWVHDHDHRYITGGSEQEEISGGVPIFEHNLVLHDMDERTITTNAGILHHSMKWLTDIKGKEKKKAYLKSVWMMVCADLYAQRMKPKELRWSYPGSFSQFDMLQYEQMYNELEKVPIVGEYVNVSTEPRTESEAVCNYALTNVSLFDRNILLGIDVGGSTSDILVVAMDRSARAFKLAKQSSIRMAAGILSDVIKDSRAVREAIFKYHETPNCKIRVANIRNIIDKPNSAPFYLNAIFDKLKEEDFKAFYSALSQTTPFIFTIPAYITGLLLYYSGQLIAKTIKENNYTGISIVDLLPFGKGGRIFDWLDVYPGKRLSGLYYNDCFKAGFGEGKENIRIEKKDSIRKDNKSEVSKGLSAPQKVTVDPAVRENSDIFGENGFIYHPVNGQPEHLLGSDNIRSEHLEEMDFGIQIPEKFEKFEEFLNIFLDFVGPRKTGIVKNITPLEQKKSQLFRELQGYITNDREWQKAAEQKRMGQPFDYKHSMLILEGICFLDKFIIPEVFK